MLEPRGNFIEHIMVMAILLIFYARTNLLMTSVTMEGQFRLTDLPW